MEGKIHPHYKNIWKFFFCISGTLGTQELGQEQYLTFYDIYAYLILLIFTLIMRLTVTCNWTKFQGIQSEYAYLLMYQNKTDLGKEWIWECDNETVWEQICVTIL